jgi:PRKCA-binding protein
MKKFKHRFIDSIDDATANALGLSRAILCNDILSKLQDRLEANQQFYTVLIRKAEDMAKCYQSIAETQVGIGGIFSEIGTHGTEEDSESFSGLAGAHKQLASQHTGMGLRLEEMINALRCHAEAAIPDVRQTLAKYLDAKYEYLSYCLRVKELEDEEAEFGLARESLPRMHSGNYEYRAMLKCRENCRTSFMEKRKQVAVKIELLDERHGW